MRREVTLSVFLLCLPLAASAQESAGEGVKAMSGMSVLGNNEAPKSLVIVPWKSSEIGDGIGLDNVLDDRAQPVDKDVFLRELSYYTIMTGGDVQPGHEATEERELVVGRE